MKNFDHILKEALNKTHTIVEQFLSYSRENANRRTLIIVPVVVICLLIPYLLFVRPPSVFPSGELVEIPEGLSLSEIPELLEREMVPLFATYLKRFDEERFLSEAEPMEGYLFPDTYFFLPNADDRLVLRTLRQSFYSRTVELEEEISASGRS